MAAATLPGLLLLALLGVAAAERSFEDGSSELQCDALSGKRGVAVYVGGDSAEAVVAFFRGEKRSGHAVIMNNLVNSLSPLETKVTWKLDSSHVYHYLGWPSPDRVGEPSEALAHIARWQRYTSSPTALAAALVCAGTKGSLGVCDQDEITFKSANGKRVTTVLGLTDKLPLLFSQAPVDFAGQDARHLARRCAQSVGNPVSILETKLWESGAVEQRCATPCIWAGAWGDAWRYEAPSLWVGRAALESWFEAYSTHGTSSEQHSQALLHGMFNDDVEIEHYHKVSRADIFEVVSLGQQTDVQLTPEAVAFAVACVVNPLRLGSAKIDLGTLFGEVTCGSAYFYVKQHFVDELIAEYSSGSGDGHPSAQTVTLSRDLVNSMSLIKSGRDAVKKVRFADIFGLLSVDPPPHRGTSWKAEFDAIKSFVLPGALEHSLLKGMNAKRAQTGARIHHNETLLGNPREYNRKSNNAESVALAIACALRGTRFDRMVRHGTVACGPNVFLDEKHVDDLVSAYKKHKSVSKSETRRSKRLIQQGLALVPSGNAVAVGIREVFRGLREQAPANPKQAYHELVTLAKSEPEAVALALVCQAKGTSLIRRIKRSDVVCKPRKVYVQQDPVDALAKSHNSGKDVGKAARAVVDSLSESMPHQRYYSVPLHRLYKALKWKGAPDPSELLSMLKNEGDSRGVALAVLCVANAHLLEDEVSYRWTDHKEKQHEVACKPASLYVETSIVDDIVRFYTINKFRSSSEAELAGDLVRSLRDRKRDGFQALSLISVFEELVAEDAGKSITVDSLKEMAHDQDNAQAVALAIVCLLRHHEIELDTTRYFSWEGERAEVYCDAMSFFVGEAPLDAMLQAFNRGAAQEWENDTSMSQGLLDSKVEEEDECIGECHNVEFFRVFPHLGRDMVPGDESRQLQILTDIAKTMGKQVALAIFCAAKHNQLSVTVRYDGVECGPTFLYFDKESARKLKKCYNQRRSDCDQESETLIGSVTSKRSYDTDDQSHVKAANVFSWLRVDSDPGEDVQTLRDFASGEAGYQVIALAILCQSGHRVAFREVVTRQWNADEENFSCTPLPFFVSTSALRAYLDDRSEAAAARSGVIESMSSTCGVSSGGKNCTKATFVKVYEQLMPSGMYTELPDSSNFKELRSLRAFYLADLRRRAQVSEGYRKKVTLAVLCASEMDLTQEAVFC